MPFTVTLYCMRVALKTKATDIVQSRCIQLKMCKDPAKISCLTCLTEWCHLLSEQVMLAD